MLGALLAEAEERANKEHDGHVSLLRFTTGWKAVWATPDLVAVWASDGTMRDDVGFGALFAEPAFPTLEEALSHLLGR